MTKTHYRARARSLRRILRGIAALLVGFTVGLAALVVTQPHMTMAITIATVAAAFVVVILALALRMAFRNLPELEQLSAKFDDEEAAGRNEQADARNRDER